MIQHIVSLVLSTIESPRTRAPRAGLTAIDEGNSDVSGRAAGVPGADSLPSFDLVDHWSVLGESDLRDAKRGGVDVADRLSALDGDLAARSPISPFRRN